MEPVFGVNTSYEWWTIHANRTDAGTGWAEKYPGLSGPVFVVTSDQLATGEGERDTAVSLRFRGHSAED